MRWCCLFRQKRRSDVQSAMLKFVTVNRIPILAVGVLIDFSRRRQAVASAAAFSRQRRHARRRCSTPHNVPTSSRSDHRRILGGSAMLDFCSFFFFVIFSFVHLRLVVVWPDEVFARTTNEILRRRSVDMKRSVWTW